MRFSVSVHHSLISETLGKAIASAVKMFISQLLIVFNSFFAFILSVCNDYVAFFLHNYYCKGNKILTLGWALGEGIVLGPAS